MANIAKVRGRGRQIAHHHKVVIAAGLGEVCFQRLCAPGPLYPAGILHFQRAGDEDHWYNICTICKKEAEA